MKTFVLPSRRAATIRPRDPPGTCAIAVCVWLLVAGRAGALEMPFAAPVVIRAGDFRAIEVADLDRDGDLDLAVALQTSPTIAWLENANDASSFNGPAAISSQAIAPMDLTIADLDRDGDLDVAWPAVLGERLGWNANRLGDGINDDFDPNHVLVTVAVDVLFSVANADFDRDGDEDLISGALAGQAAWYENTAQDGSTWSRTALGASTSGEEPIALADLDRDGDIDIVLGSSGAVAWAENRLRDGVHDDFDLALKAVGTPEARALAAGDLDRDGDPDVVVASQTTPAYTWHENRLGDGINDDFDPAANGLPTGDAAPVALSLVDLDRDGDLDVLTASESDGLFSYYENLGTGSFASQRPLFDSAHSGSDIRAADLDRDGDLDIVTASYSDAPSTDGELAWHENLSIHRNGTFPVITWIWFDTDPRWVTPADVDGDGDLDLLHTSEVQVVAWSRNDGTGDIGGFYTVGLVTATDHIIAADLDVDGDIDVLLSDNAGVPDSKIVWFRNDGLGTFDGPHLVSSAQVDARVLVAADLDRDGDPDVVSASPSDGSLMWHENRLREAAHGDFDPVANVISTGNSDACCLLAADLDRDGDEDVVLGTRGDGSIRWHENRLGDGVNDDIAGTPTLVSSAVAGLQAITVVDADRDGDPDLASASYLGDEFSNTENEISLFRNDCTGAFGMQELLVSLRRGPHRLLASDIDLDGDDDLVFSAVFDNYVGWFENLDGAGTFAPESALAFTHNPVVLAIGDVDRDGDPDLVTSDAGPVPPRYYLLIPNGGGQFGLPTVDTAPPTILDGTADDVLRIDARHNGSVTEADVQLVRIELCFTDGGPGCTTSGLTSAEANAIIAELRVHRDDGDGTFEPLVDLLVTSVSDLTLVDGVQTISFGAGDPLALVPAGLSASFFVVVQTSSDASAQAPNVFRVRHLTQTAGEAKDADHDLALRREITLDETSGAVLAASPTSDADGDGIPDVNETRTSVYVSPSDTGTDPLLPDTDGDGYDDGLEVSKGTDPNDPESTPAFVVSTSGPLGQMLVVACLLASGAIAIRAATRERVGRIMRNPRIPHRSP